MNYLDLIKASKGKDKIPSLEKLRWSKTERARAEQGVCMQCGSQPAGESSFLCIECEAGQSREEIQAEIARVRKQILGGAD